MEIENHKMEIENHKMEIENHKMEIYIYITNYKTNYKTMGGLRQARFGARRRTPCKTTPNPQRGLNLQYLTGDSRSESSRVYSHNILSA